MLFQSCSDPCSCTDSRVPAQLDDDDDEYTVKDTCGLYDGVLL